MCDSVCVSAEQLKGRGTSTITTEDIERLTGRKPASITADDIQKLAGRGDIDYFRDLLLATQAQSDNKQHSDASGHSDSSQPSDSSHSDGPASPEPAPQPKTR